MRTKTPKKNLPSRDWRRSALAVLVIVCLLLSQLNLNSMVAYATSSGKAMLSCQNEAYIDDYCQWMNRKAYPLTSNTITDSDQLRSQLVQARLNGYAMDDGEIEAGLICVAAPVYDMNRKVVAAVSISGPDYRMREDQEVMIREARQTAHNISRLLGYRL